MSAELWCADFYEVMREEENGNNLDGADDMYADEDSYDDEWTLDKEYYDDDDDDDDEE